MAGGEGTRIQHEIDFDRPGRQAGYLRAPLSRNTSGWGVVLIPIVVVNGAPGPTVLFTGGVHGDEYEGPIAVSRLAATLRPEELRGRVILMPVVNPPAVLNDTRLSPADQRDMNRCFPGDPKGSISQMIAHFMDGVILPMVDVSMDLHTAGHSGDSALSTNMHAIPDLAMRRRTMAAAEAFGAPFNVVFSGVDEGATFTSCVERRGKLSLGTELGGWGRVSVEGVRIGRRGVLNTLKYLEMIEGRPETAQRDGSAGTRHMMVAGPESYAFAPGNGLFEPANMVGEPTRAGQPCGWLHFVEEVDRPPLEVRYDADGLLWMSAGPGRVQRGDVVGVVMTDYDEAALG